MRQLALPHLLDLSDPEDLRPLRPDLLDQSDQSDPEDLRPLKPDLLDQ